MERERPQLREQPEEQNNTISMKKPRAKELRLRRHKRIRAKVLGTKECPRLVVFRSNSHIYAQLINDEIGKTLASASDVKFEKKGKKAKNEIAKEIGKMIAENAAKLKISKVVFDRAGYKYHGNIKALADGAREGGLKF